MRCEVSFNSFDPLGEGDEREWLRSRPPRRNLRRFWIAVAVLIVVLLGLWWIIFRGLFRGDTLSPIPAGTTAAAPARPNFPAQDEQVVAGAQRALQAWGEFAVTGDLATLEDTFWKQGLQYQQLAKEARAIRRRGAGPPPYQFTLTPRQVLPGPGGQRIVRGSVRMSRSGEPTRSFQWDIYMQRARGSGNQPWRLWTVDTTRT
jgi:hypothetical protein